MSTVFAKAARISFLALGGHPPGRDARVAREEALQGLAPDPGLGASRVRAAEAEGASPRTS